MKITQLILQQTLGYSFRNKITRRGRKKKIIFKNNSKKRIFSVEQYYFYLGEIVEPLTGVSFSIESYCFEGLIFSNVNQNEIHLHLLSNANISFYTND